MEGLYVQINDNLILIFVVAAKVNLQSCRPLYPVSLTILYSPHCPRKNIQEINFFAILGPVKTTSNI